MTITQLDFAVWAPSEAIFWQSWLDAGIIEMVEGERQYTKDYPGIFVSTDGGWGGKIVKTPAVLDEDGNEVTPAVMVDGWHTNARVTGPLVAQMTYGLDQYENDGETLKSVLERTHAASLFGLTVKGLDSETQFPEGLANTSAGVSYADPKGFSSPSNVIL